MKVGVASPLRARKTGAFGFFGRWLRPTRFSRSVPRRSEPIVANAPRKTTGLDFGKALSGMGGGVDAGWRPPDLNGSLGRCVLLEDYVLEAPRRSMRFGTIEFVLQVKAGSKIGGTCCGQCTRKK
jgi:hypothetical protein